MAMDEKSDFDGEDQKGENWVLDEMRQNRHKWTKGREISIFCGTWNVNAKVCSETLGPWLLTDKKNIPDVYCIGMQEIVELNAVNIGVSDGNSAKQSGMWEDKLEREVLKGRYTKILGKHLVGIMLVVYVRNSIVMDGAVSEETHEKIGVGRMGLGNKGAICIRMNLWETTICFVNTHLTAGKSKTANRNNDFTTIMEKVEFRLSNGKTVNIRDHDYCFWVGDLNYRLNATDLGDVYKRIRANDLVYLHNTDQLITERDAGRTFHDFFEQEISFMPTYKYIPGTREYDNREDGKKRMPAWCDRVQWYIKPKTEGLAVKGLSYERAELHCSDHKPVMALFSVTALVPLAKEKVERFRKDLIRKEDENENEGIPQVSLSKNTIDLKDVYFDKRASDSLKIKNTGKAMAVYHFVPVPGGIDEVAIKPWIQIHPDSAILVPGASREIVVTAHITKEFAQRFTSGEENIEHILILQLKSGRSSRKNQEEGVWKKSQFISVNGKYIKSCFGCSLEFLNTASAAIRSTKMSTLSANQAYKIPKELWRLVDYLFRRGGLYEPELFVHEGEPEQINAITEALDTGAEFGKFSLHSMAETLIRFLINLKDPIFPETILEQVELNWAKKAMIGFCKLALRQLTPSQYRVFTYIVAFIREILKHFNHNKLSVDMLVPVFAKCLFEQAHPSSTERAHMILRAFLLADNFM